MTPAGSCKGSCDHTQTNQSKRCTHMLPEPSIEVAQQLDTSTFQTALRMHSTQKPTACTASNMVLPILIHSMPGTPSLLDPHTPLNMRAALRKTIGHEFKACRSAHVTSTSRMRQQAYAPSDCLSKLQGAVDSR